MAGAGASRGKGTSSVVKIYANIFVSFIGAGILGLPYAFKVAGLAEGAFVMTIVAVVSVKAMLMVIECKYTMVNRDTPESKQSLLEEDAKASDLRRSSVLSDQADAISYADIGRCVAGVAGQRVVELSLLLSQVGFCCAYLIFITENLSTYVPNVDKRIFLAALLPFLFLLTLYKELRGLAFFSLFAQVSNLMAFAVVFWFDLEHIYLLDELHPREFSAKGLPFFFCVAIYCFEGAGMILSLESSVSKSKREHFRYYFISCIIVVTTLYILFGSLGYLSFGESTKPIITLNLKHEGGGLDFAMVVKGFLCAALFFTYPLMMFPVTKLLERLPFFSGRRSIHPAVLDAIDAKRDPDSVTWKEVGLRLCLVISTGVVVLIIPNFDDLMALIGATCCMLLAFILPGLFHLRLHYSRISRAAMALDICIIVLGVIGVAAGTIDTFSRMAKRAARMKAKQERLLAMASTTTGFPGSSTGEGWSWFPTSSTPLAGTAMYD